MDLNISPMPRDDPDSVTDSMLRKESEVVEDNGEENECKFSTSSSFGQLNPTITDPSTEFTEDDIFRMKSLSFANKRTASELQSAISNVDSASNFEEDEHLEEGSTNFQSEGMEMDENEIKLQTNNTSESDILRSDMNMSSLQESRDAVHRKTTVHSGYVFGRGRPEKLNLNQDTVTVLQYPFEPLLIPSEGDATEYRKAFSNAKVYIVGTAHFSHESQQDVIQTIQQTQPDLVMVELCSSRISILLMDEQALLREASSLNREKILAIIKQSGLIQGLLHILLLSISAHITRQLEMAPGGEFRAAHGESRKVMNCGLVLGDRPLQVTLKRALNSLNFFQKMRFFYHIFLTNQTPITPEDVERCKNKDLLEALLKEMAGEFPQLSKILVDERDQYMTNVLHTIMQKSTIEKVNACRKTNAEYEPVNVVAVVGIGHVAGIVANWNRHIDNTELLIVPKPSLTYRTIKLLFKLSLLAGTGYVSFKFGRMIFRNVPRLFNFINVNNRF